MTAALTGALLLSACSDGDGTDDKASAAPAPTATPTAGAGGGTGTASTSAGDLEGNWLAGTGGKAVVLVVHGTEAGVFTTGGTVCSGTAGAESGTQTIHLKCTDGSKDRASGTVASVDGGTLRITWQGALGTETYTRSEGGTLPSGLPTANLGS
ncbi:hypothetical protein JS756_32665 [Streptomyces actuosus]|uniref:Serine/threonine protein kinase n=1 Tax=Streptomyces actuosus TaxID=1885 RepID=A0ABS2W010_STRAS|nr:hypothetical protein [Streptomyces actuosus]